MSKLSRPTLVVTDSPSPRRTTLEKVYAEWLQARATLAALDVSEADNDTEEVEAALDAAHSAEWMLIGTRSKGRSDLKIRARVLQQMLIDAEQMGHLRDGRHTAMMSVLVSEILRGE